jgi:predicted metal-dependent hydrolase
MTMRKELGKLTQMIDQRFQTACDCFNRGEYFEAHEYWEELWNEASGKEHAFLQCLIQVAVALHHGRNGNWKGSRKLCASALGYLERARGAEANLDLDELRDKVLEIEIAVQKIQNGESGEIPFFKLPFK